MSSHERRLCAALALFVLVLWFVILPQRPLFNPDEGRYAEIPREMLAGGDWLIPHLNGLVYIEKPPLQYWATALGLTLFGLNEFGARIYTALCALGTVLAVGLTANRLWGGAAGWRSAMALAAMPLFVMLGELLTLDMSLTFYMTLALAGFLCAQSAPRGKERGWMLLAWAAAALGVLTKGLVAAALPAGALLLYSLWARQWAPWRRLHLAAGLPLFLLLTVPWGVLAARRLPDFVDFFFVHEHLRRYLTPSADREEVWWFFGPVLLLGSLPWTVSAVRVLITGWRRGAPRASPRAAPGGVPDGAPEELPPGEFNPELFLWIWAWFVCLFFSLSDSKLVPYILPALPALALSLGALPAEVFHRDLKRSALGTFGAALALALACHYAPRIAGPGERGAHFAALARPLAEVAALLAVSGVYVWVQRAGSVTRRAVFLSAGWCLSGLLMMRAATAVAPIYSGVTLARALPEVPADAALYSVATYDQTLPFYWRRTFALVAYRGELDYGLRRNPEGETPSVEEFVERWSMQSSAYAVMEHDTFERLKGQGVPMREVAHDVRRVLVARQ